MASIRNFCFIALTLLFHQSLAASYEITFKGIKAGEAELTFDISKEKYRVTLALFPVLLAKLSGMDDMTESANGKLINGHFYPKTYQRIDESDKILLRVDFTKEKAKIFGGKKEKYLDISTMGQDPLSQIAQIQYDLSINRLQDIYYLVTENNQRKYSAVQMAKEVVLTELPSKRRQLLLWFDENNHLIKMQKKKAGKIQFSMQKI